MNKPDPTEYIRLIKQALTLTPPQSAAEEKQRQALYDQAGVESTRLRNGGWTIPELDDLIAKETGRRIIR